MTPDPLPREDAGARLGDALRELAGPYPSAIPLALGWATVDLDRAEGEFAAVFGDSLAVSPSASDDALLGARCRIMQTGDPRIPIVVLLEPTTEGRLASTLAHQGEGPAAAWLQAVPDPTVARPDGRPTPPPRSVPAIGPFGTEVLLLGGRAAGPHRLLVLVTPGTISP